MKKEEDSKTLEMKGEIGERIIKKEELIGANLKYNNFINKNDKKTDAYDNKQDDSKKNLKYTQTKKKGDNVTCCCIII